MNKRLSKICAAVMVSFCMSAVFASAVCAEPQAVVGDMPGEEETSAAAESSAAAQKAAESAGLVPALTAETKPKETTAASTRAAETTAASTRAAETASAPTKAAETTAASTRAAETASAPTKAAESSAAPTKASETAATVNAAPKPAEETSAAAPPAEGKSTYSADAPRPDAESQTPAAGSASPQSAPDPEKETLTKEEMEALDRVTGPGVQQLQAGSSYGVNEPVVDHVQTSGTAPATDWSTVSDTRRRIVDMAKSFVGGTYVYGGASPSEGFDCSGLILYVYKEAAGIELYHQSAVQATKGRAVSVQEMQPGDIIAYDGSPKDGQVNHVSIYAGDGKAIHAVGTGKGIRITAYDYAAPLTIRNLLGD